MIKNYYFKNFKLDENQIAILNNNCNMMVIAGAGSGKTFTIAAKVNYLIKNSNINPKEILVVSFTNNSVTDLKGKLNPKVNICTFHKLAINILQKVKFKYKICSENLLKYIIKEKIITCNKSEQKTILKFLKINMNYQQFLKCNYFDSFCRIVFSYISFYKTYNFSFKNLKFIKYSKIEKKIIIIIMKIYKSYIIEKSSQQLLDFDDLILIATKFAKSTNLNYKYIIIDEFQDSSMIRLNLIKSIYNENNTKILVVGDDWQSIYQFSGCDINIFLNFDTYFKNVVKLQLNNTYRNSQQLIDIATKFIEKNPLQIKKKLLSSKNCPSPIVFVPYNNTNILQNVFEYLLKISNDILIISRNNNDIYKYLSKNIKFENNNIIYKNKTIKYLTIHKSKGLEAKYVILLNCNDDKLGFPNKIENSSIINKFFSKEKIKYSEERRIFYVAITRCKEKIFLLYEKNHPSIFIKETKKICRKLHQKINYF